MDNLGKFEQREIERTGNKADTVAQPCFLEIKMRIMKEEIAVYI